MRSPMPLGRWWHSARSGAVPGQRTGGIRSESGHTSGQMAADRGTRGDGASSTWILGTGAPAAELGEMTTTSIWMSCTIIIARRMAPGCRSAISKGANGAGINQPGRPGQQMRVFAGDGVTSNGSVWCCKVPHTGQEAAGHTGRRVPFTGICSWHGVQVGCLALRERCRSWRSICWRQPASAVCLPEGSGSTAARRLYTLNIPAGQYRPGRIAAN